MSESLGPFRRDGRMHFATESHSNNLAQRVMRVGVHLELSAYLFFLSLGPVAFAVATQSVWVLFVSAVTMFAAWKLLQNVVRTNNAARSERNRTWITREGILSDDDLGLVKWSWDCVIGARVAGSYVVVELALQSLALSVPDDDQDHVVSFIRAHAQSQKRAPGDGLLGLAILYTALVIVCVVVAR